MTLIERLNKDLADGRFSNGLTLKIHYSSGGNIYNYLVDDDLYKSF